MAVNAKLVKELREKTGAGMLDCKKALEATDGNIEAAFDWLREKGIAKAAKKADRIAAEGLTAFAVDNDDAVIIEVNSETDFVSKNQQFKDLVAAIASCVLKNKPATMEEALQCEMDGETLNDAIIAATSRIGEKISFRRFAVLTKKENQTFGAYSHMGGRITALVLVENATPEKARDVAMHVAASAPQYISRDDIPADVLEKERHILQTQALEENSQAAKPKPENIVVKMVEGRLNKNLAEMCLNDQAFVKDPNQKISQYLGEGKVVSMVRYLVGEGMQKREENFAEEVAAQIKK